MFTDIFSLPRPQPPPDTLAERLARLRALLDRADELKRRPDAFAGIEADLRRLERVLEE
jgi:hypothetical protein